MVLVLAWLVSPRGLGLLITLYSYDNITQQSYKRHLGSEPLPAGAEPTAGRLCLGPAAPGHAISSLWSGGDSPGTPFIFIGVVAEEVPGELRYRHQRGMEMLW